MQHDGAGFFEGSDALRSKLNALLTRAENHFDGPVRAELLVRAAQTLLDEAGDLDGALAALGLAWQSAPFEPAVLAGLERLVRGGGDVAAIWALVERELPRLHLDDAPRALPLYERLWRASNIEAFGFDRAALAFGLAQARLSTGDSAGGRVALEATVLFAPEHGEALAQLAVTLAAEGDVAAAMRAFDRARASLERDDERAALVVDVAHALCAAGHRKRAFTLLRDARVTHPTSRPVLVALLELAIEGQHWRIVVDTLGGMTDLSWGHTRARILVAMAHVLRRHLRAPLAAVARFEEALDLEPMDLDVFAQVVAIHSERGDDVGQAQSYRHMLARLAGVADNAAVRHVRVVLLRNLGALSRRLGGRVAAQTAFEGVTRLAPGDKAALTALADLHEDDHGDARAQSIAHRRTLIELAEHIEDVAPQVRAVVRFAQRTEQEALAFRAREALVALGAAREDERHLAESAAARFRRRPPEIDEQAWAAIAHPDLRDAPDEPPGALTTIATLVGAALVEQRRAKKSTWGLATLRGDEAHGTTLSALTTELATALGVQRPILAPRPGLPGLIDLVPVDLGDMTWPVFVLGAEALQPRRRPELVAMLAGRLALLRPELLVLWPTLGATADAFELAIAALQRLCGHTPIETPGFDARAVDRRARSLRRLASDDDLHVVTPLLAGVTRQRARAYLRAGVLTAGRAALVASGSLGATCRLIATEPRGTLTVTAFEQRRDLVSFTLSPEHVSLFTRVTNAAAIGVSVRTGAAQQRSA